MPLTAGRTLAVDSSQIPLGTPVFLATVNPVTNQPLDSLVIAQDTSGGLHGANEADLFFGAGPDAEIIAGRMRQQSTLYLLLPKPAPKFMTQTPCRAFRHLPWWTCTGPRSASPPCRSWKPLAAWSKCRATRPAAANLPSTPATAPTAREIGLSIITAFAAYDYVVAPSGSCAGMISRHFAASVRRRSQSAGQGGPTRRQNLRTDRLPERYPELPAPPRRR